MRLLTTLASSLGVALENARLFDETQAAPDRDQRARRRAGDHQQRPAGPRREARHAGDVRPRRRQDPGDLRRPGRRHRDRTTRTPASSTSRTRSSAACASRTSRMPISGFRTQVDRDRRAVLVDDDIAGARPSAGHRSDVSSGEPPKSALFVPLIAGGEVQRRHLAPEPRPRGRLQRGRRPAARRRSPPA